jgi:methyltransferase (TIGR00027 family)
MVIGKPSRTALAAAAYRAAHQVLDEGSIFSDPLAIRILGADADAAIARASEGAGAARMRVFIAVRTRFAEDALAAAFAAGVRQTVVLGAGLDTFAYRTTLGPQLRVFEVDHPATQSWKRQLLEEAGIPLPDCLTFAPVDFEHETLAAGLEAAGFDSGQPAFFTWLGVVPYLTAEAIWSTLRFIAALPGGAQVVFDYADPPETLSPEARAAHERRAARVASIGESFLTYFEPPELHAQLAAVGFRTVEDLGPREIVAKYLPWRKDAAPSRGGHILRASTMLYA